MNSAGVILQNPVSKVDRWVIKTEDIQIEDKIGSCSHFGGIFEAVDKRTNEKVTARSYDSTTPESLNTFLMEAEVLKQCSHSNIAR